MAEAARGEAEKLIVYLLDDFYLELEPVGRLDIVAELAKRALDYYDALPAELRTPQTERNRALALVRYGAVLRTQSKLDDGDEGDRRGGRRCSVGCASRATPPRSTAIGLALGLTTQARLAVQPRPEGRRPAHERSRGRDDPSAGERAGRIAATRTARSARSSTCTASCR